MGDNFNDFRINDDMIKTNQIWLIQRDLVAPVKHRVLALLSAGDADKFKLDNQRILLRLLIKTMPQNVQHFHRTTNNPMHLVLQ